MADGATIIAASLNSEELDKSINKLVETVNRKTKEMAQSFDSSVQEMKRSLQSLGDTKIKFQDTGGSKRVSDVKRESEARKELTTTLDREAEARQKAAQPKSARDSYIVFMQESKKQAEHLTQLINSWESLMLNRQIGRFDAVGQQIDAVNARIRELKQNITDLRKEQPAGYRDTIKQREADIDSLKAKIVQLREEQKKIEQEDPLKGSGSQYLQQLRAERERMVNLLREEKTENQQVAQATQQATQATQQQSQAQQQLTQGAKQYTDEVKKQAQAIRESREWKEQGHAIVTTKGGMDGVVYSQHKLSLEEQLSAIYRQETSEIKAAAKAEREEVEEKNKAVQEAQRQLHVEKQITQQTAQRTTSKNSPIPTFIPQLESANALSKRLKELKEQFNNLSYGKRLSEGGQKIAQNIRTITREAQILNQQLMRPSSKKEILGLSETTLDNIAYKLRQLNSYKRGLNLVDPKQAAEIKWVDNEINRLNSDLNKYMVTTQRASVANNTLSRSWNYMKNRLAFYATVGASTQLVKNLIQVRSEYEMNERALGILINSAERGSQIFNELSQMALVSPYTLIELSAAAKQLTAYDIAAKDVVDTTRRLADMASAVGVPIERLTYALGQIKAYGYLNSRDNRMFANAGIPLVKQLSDYYTELEGKIVSTADVYDRIKKKAVDYNDVMQVINRMTDEGGKFFDFQAKMADTLKVRLANLTLAWNNMLNEVGESTQGMLVGGLNALKTMFVYWRDISHVITEVAVGLGAYKIAQVALIKLMGVSAGAIKAQVLAQKQSNATFLTRQSLLRKLTVSELRAIATRKTLTAEDYKNALSARTLTKQQALLLAAFNKKNVALKAALVNMGLLTAAEVSNITKGKALILLFKSLGVSIAAAAKSIAAFAVSNWWLIALAGIYELYHAWDSYHEHIKEVNRDAAQNAKQVFEDLKSYLESSNIKDLYQGLFEWDKDKEGNTVKVGNRDIDTTEANKAWESMREKIELASAASNTFIATLEQENDVNERLRKGFDYLDDIMKVAGAMKTMSDDAVQISSTTWGGVLGEGLTDDLKDYINSLDAVEKKYKDVNKAWSELKKQQEGGFSVGLGNDLRDLQEFQNEVQKVTNSIWNFSDKEGFGIAAQREFLERMITETAQKEQMSTYETRIYRIKAEEEYYNFAKAKLEERLKYQSGAQAEATRQQLKQIETEFNSNKAMQETFFAWLAEKHSSNVQKMMQNKTQEEIKQGEWLKGKNKVWVEDMARKFSEEYHVSFNDLYSLVLKADTWSIHIPVYFQTIGQPLTDLEKDYEERTGKRLKENPVIKDATSQVDIIDKLKKKQKELQETINTAQRAGGEYYRKNKKEWDSQNQSLISQIHSYNALTDAEEAAQKQNRKTANARDKQIRKEESEIQRALKDELQLIDKIRNTYKDLTKEGLSHIDAVESATRGYGKSVDTINQTLTKYGLTKFDPAKYAGISNPRELVELLQKQLDDLMKSGRVKPSEIQDIEVKIREINVDAEKYDLKKITDGLNNELGKLKEEYELAVELDANPELGDIFANMLGVSESDLADIPRKAEDVATKAQNIINNIFKENNVDDVFNLEQNLNKANLKAWAERNGHDLKDELMLSLTAIVDYVNKARLDQTKKQVEEWDKLLEKYAEYEYKKDALRKQYEREMQVATKRGAGDDIINAITNKYKTELAQLDFEEFQKTPYWVTATGELSSLTTDALGLLIDKLEQYKKTAQNLSPKQIERINKALRSMRKEVRKDNPWRILANAMDEAKARGEVFDESIQKTENQIAALEQKIAAQRKNNNGIADEKDIKTLNSLYEALKQLKDAQESVSKVSYKDVIEQIDAYLTIAQSAAGVFQQIAQATKDSSMARSADLASDILGNFQAAGQGFASGGWIGAVAAGVGDLLPKIFKWASAENDIDDSIKESERSVKRLEYAYIDLQQAIDNAYGTAVVGAKQAALANKALQMEEIKRQIQLEKSRSSKKRDEDKIIDLEKQYKDLYYEIKNGTKEIVDDLMGTDVSGFAENMVKSMISAFKQGEDYMKVFEDSFESMIDNMIMKSIVSRVVAQYMNALWDNLDNRINERSKQEADAYARAQNEAQRISSMTDQEIADEMGFGFVYRNSTAGHDIHDRYQATIDEYRDTIKREEDAAKKQLDAASQITNSDITDIMAEVGAIMPELGEKLKAILGEYYRFGQDGDNNLSALQAGIKGITEEQAGALEAYWNANTQQQYVQTDLLTQIRDTIIGFDLDVQVATMSQILLQLQASYQSQMAIQNILTSVLTPSGRAFSVELIN